MTETGSSILGDAFSRTRIDAGQVGINVAYGGHGPPLLLLHGYPQTHLMWHQVAERLARDFTVVCPDLRGYGDSAKPASDADHAPYSKRAMAADQVAVMSHLGFERFGIAGHDRGGRVAHRMALDYPQRVRRAAVLDIVATYRVFATVDQNIATGYYHWFFLIQPDGLPERLIGNDPAYYLREKLKRWSASAHAFDPAVVAEYIRCFEDPATIHATCEDYRAAATIDLAHDRADLDRKLECPLLVLWGEHGLMGRSYDVLGTWRERAPHAEGKALPCGHFLPEEDPDGVYRELASFFKP